MGLGYFGGWNQAGMTGASKETAVTYDDSASYERFMGPWSRAAGAIFLDWLAPPDGVRWLDIGCGTGAFTNLILRTCAPLMIDGVDAQPAQIQWAERQRESDNVTFRTGDAHQLPFDDNTYDVVASALVLNFLADRSKALNEMRRVARPGAVVAGYLWDFANERTPNSGLSAGLRQIGIEVPRIAGTAGSSLPSLVHAFEQAAYSEITSITFEVTIAFSTFEEFWHSQTPSFSPITKIISTLAPSEKSRLIENIRKRTLDRNGGASWSAYAHAIKVRVP